MIFFENSYSADTRDRIEDRIHRRGQTGEAVLYIDLSGCRLRPADRQSVATERRFVQISFMELSGRARA